MAHLGSLPHWEQPDLSSEKGASQLRCGIVKEKIGLFENKFQQSCDQEHKDPDRPEEKDAPPFPVGRVDPAGVFFQAFQGIVLVLPEPAKAVRIRYERPGRGDEGR